MALTIRALKASDLMCLRIMLYHAIYVEPGTLPPPTDIVDTPELAQYIKGFGQQSGDIGVMALMDSKCVGAAWVRLMKGYGFIAEGIPELSIAVLPEYRGQGIGSLLLTHLFTAITPHFQQVCLSVNENNPAKRLYERFDFTLREVNDGTAVMLKQL